MKYLVDKRNIWTGPVYFRVADGAGTEVFRIASIGSRLPRFRSRSWTLQDTFGNPLTVLRKASFWSGTFEIERAGEVIGTIRRARRGPGKLRYEILLATGARLLASRTISGRKYDVRSAEGQPFCRLERPWFRNDRIVEVAAGADLVLALSVIACFIMLQDIGDSPP